jgi:hypothetical protein
VQSPAPLALSARRVFAAAAALQRDLRLSEAGLAVALRRAPAALAAPPGRVGALAGVLSGRMQVAEDVALDLLLQVIWGLRGSRPAAAHRTLSCRGSASQWHASPVSW